MSHDIDLTDPITGEVLRLDEKHHMKGGTYAIGGDYGLSLNVTYNYGEHLWRVLGKGGVTVIYGMTGADSIPILESAISQLRDDVDFDYWKATEGNAKRALLQLLSMAKMRPDGIWKGD